MTTNATQTVRRNVNLFAYNNAYLCGTFVDCHNTSHNIYDPLRSDDNIGTQEAGVEELNRSKIM